MVRRPHPFQFQEILILPPLQHPFPRVSLRRQTQVHNRTISNVLCDRVLAVGNICIHILYDWLRHCLLQWGVESRLIRTPPWMPPCKHVEHPVVEVSQSNPNPRGHNSFSLITSNSKIVLDSILSVIFWMLICVAVSVFLEYILYFLQQMCR